MTCPESPKKSPAKSAANVPGTPNPAKALADSIQGQLREVRSIQDLLKLGHLIVELVREKLNRRVTANIATPKELFEDVEKVHLALGKANRSLQTPKERLHASPQLIDDLRKELRQLARLGSRPETDSRNYHNTLVVMAALARKAGIPITLDVQPNGRAYLIIHAETGQISFSATGGGVERLGVCLGLAPGDPSWDGHTSAEREERIKQLASSTRG
jgi:hypothetical protein